MAHCSSLLRWGLTLLRIVIGWHFLYEGVVKLTSRNWTSAEYLRDATGIFAEFFRAMADSPAILRLVDALNIWGLTLIGLCLVVGYLTRLSVVLGAVLVLLYYLANPPFVGLRGMVGEGSYLVVNKNLVEIICLMVLVVVPRGWLFGLDGFLAGRSRQRGSATDIADGRIAQGPTTAGESPAPPRRQLLKDMIGVPVLGAFGYAVHRKKQWESLEEKYLLDAKADGLASATLKTFAFSQLGDLKGAMTHGRIGNLEVSRVILGGNLIGGWAHARDLVYVSDLVKAYHSDERVINTFRLAERCGVNTILTHPKLLRIIRKYWREYGGHIQYVADCGGDDLPGMIKLAIEGGAHACYIQGATADRLVTEGKVDQIPSALAAIRAHNMPAGIGAHGIGTVKACLAAGIHPDFWMKTLHHHKYWSARPEEPRNDNNFCAEPQETIDVMKNVPEPWIAFKVLAAGAIQPRDGFTYALQNGADFLCVGMYDFQIVQDVNIAMEVLGQLKNRERPWRT